jgi:hypothetical protein
MVLIMTGNQVVSTMFNFNTCNHMVIFVLRDDGNEDPGSYHSGPRMRWSIHDFY